MSLSAWKLSDLPCVTLAAVSTEFRCRRKPKRLGRRADRPPNSGPRSRPGNYLKSLYSNRSRAGIGGRFDTCERALVKPILVDAKASSKKRRTLWDIQSKLPKSRHFIRF